MKDPQTNPSAMPTRRADTEKVVVGSYYDGTKRYFDENLELTVIKIYSGEYYVTNKPGEMIVTILGSCISACIRDPIAGVGGMNHFLLPGNSAHFDHDFAHASEAARYGVFAMEQLINEIIKLGGVKSRFEVKLFGGGNVTSSTAMIGDKNVEFVRDFIAEEGLKVDSEHLGGKLPRRIHYYPDTGKVMMRLLKRKEDLRIIEEEKTFEKTISKKPVEGDVELF